MSSNLSAILAWGVELGDEDDDRALLFFDLVDVPGTWEIVYYGDGHRMALCLARSIKEINAADEDKSLEGWLSFTFEGGDFSLVSEPGVAELAELKKIIEETPGAMQRDDLFMAPILLPAYF
jgi:hypothetical protein